MTQHRYRRARFLVSARTLDQLPADRGREVAFAGRSNAGKSSVINALTGIKGLARASRTPGRTQLLNFFELDDGARLVDIPGYGYARAPKPAREAWSRTLDGYFRNRRCLAGLVLIVDVRRDATDMERDIAGWCEAAGIPLHVLLNKADKPGRAAVARSRAAMARELALPPDAVQPFSALRGEGVDALRAVLDGWLWP